MQIFELHFNPKAKEDYIFGTFLHEPENTSERKLGGLYQAGEAKNAVPKRSLDFMAQISKVIRKGYYSSESKEQEKALLFALKRANEHLSDEVRTGNVNWLGNLNFTALSLKDSEIAFTITGDMKIVLMRNGELIDIGKELNLKEIEPYPLKVFFNTASGKISEKDTLFIATKEVYIFLREQGVLGNLSKCSKIESAEIKKNIPQALFSKGEGSKISGFFLIFTFSKKNDKKNTLEMLFQREGKKDDAPRLFSFSLLIKKLKQGIKNIRIPAPKIPKSAPIIEKLKKVKKPRKKAVLLIVSFVLLLLLGFLILQVVGPKKEVVQPRAEERMIEGMEKVIGLTEADLGFTPEQISLFGSDLYIYNLNSNKFAKFNLESKSLNKQEIDKNILKIDVNSESPFLLTKDGIYYFSEKGWTEMKIDKDLGNSIFSSYLSNLYFLDKDSCQILKSSYLEVYSWSSIKNWSVNKNYCSKPKSMAIDGSLWILNDNGEILKYYAGKIQNRFNLDSSLNPTTLDKMDIRVNLPYLYFSSSQNNRVITTDKEGKLVKKFEGSQLGNIKDFSISEDGKTIYLLNGLDIYKLAF
jgi:hypothetical protein